MRLVFFCAAGMVSGKEKQTFNMMAALKARGHDIFCVMSSWGSLDFEHMLRKEQIPHTRMRTGFISKTFNWPAIRMTLHQLVYVPGLWRDYRKLVRSFRPDAVVHTNFQHLFLLLPVSGTAKQVFYVHDYMPPGGFTKRLFSNFNRKVKTFIGVSQFICDSLPPLGVDPSKIKLVHNGITAIHAASKVRMGESIVVGIVGQIAPWKGHEILVRSLGAIKHLANWKLYVIGDGIDSYKEMLRGIAAEVGVAARVEFRGRVEGLEKIYEGLDIVVVPSVKPESFGLTAVEPALFGIPVICSSVGALPEVVLDRRTGIVVGPGDVSALATALERLISDPLERRRLGEEALESVRKRFSMDVTAGEFEKAMDDKS